MKRLTGYIAIIFAFLTYPGCVTEIEPESIGFEDLLVVEGLLTNQAVRQTVKLSRTSQLNSNQISPLTGANVTVETDNQGDVSFIEESPGIYTTTFPFAASSGSKYQLKIVLENGREYVSDNVEMVEAPPIDTLYAEFVPDINPPVSSLDRTIGFFNFYFDIKNNGTSTRAFRYRWSEVYRIKVPNPSRWKWLGGNDFEFRLEDNPETQQEYCFRHDTTNQIIVGESFTSSGELLRFPIHSFRARRQLNIRYTIEVVQYGLSPSAERFWKNLAMSSQTQGSLFDLQPGTITGNMRSIANPKETVLGIFEVVEEHRLRAYFRASDFFDQGFSNYSTDWIDCDQELIIVPEEQAGPFMIANNEKYELLYYISGGGGAVFGIKACALCTLYGTNIEPEFWKD